MAEKGAWDRLEQAIEDFLNEDEQPGLLLDWIIVTHKIEAQPDGSNQAATGYLGAEHQTSYRSLGLLEYAAQIVRNEITESMGM